MKKLTLLLLLVPALFYAQQEETIKVFELKNGIKDILPVQIIKVSPQKTEVYQTTNGIQNILPSQIIIDNKVYPVVNGVKDIVPSQVIEIE
tara:strand:+ start:597 stop:869 length:273 start_codon:yes stop_codon:yes gene_type:complete